MRVIHDAQALTDFAGGVFVPTMGALHAGHVSLVHEARKRADASGSPVVVSVFVNPTQFGPGEDFTRYPRTLDADTAACRDAGADVVFAPPVEVIYPAGTTTPSGRVPRLPDAAFKPGLEDRIRPGHFAGVCRVVLRLFELVSPRVSIFGEKDWQQLQVVKAMVEHESLPIEIVGMPTVREPDGLAMSSRNRFLSPDDRRRASAISRALCDACQSGILVQAESILLDVLARQGISPDYAVIRDARTLLPPGADPNKADPNRPWQAGIGGSPLRALVAAKVGTVRLLDNAQWPCG